MRDGNGGDIKETVTRLQRDVISSLRKDANFVENVRVLIACQTEIRTFYTCEFFSDLEESSLQLSPEDSARLKDAKEEAVCAELYEDRFGNYLEFVHVPKLQKEIKDRIS